MLDKAWKGVCKFPGFVRASVTCTDATTVSSSFVDGLEDAEPEEVAGWDNINSLCGSGIVGPGFDYDDQYPWTRNYADHDRANLASGLENIRGNTGLIQIIE